MDFRLFKLMLEIRRVLGVVFRLQTALVLGEEQAYIRQFPKYLLNIHVVFGEQSLALDCLNELFQGGRRALENRAIVLQELLEGWQQQILLIQWQIFIRKGDSFESLLIHS